MALRRIFESRIFAGPRAPILALSLGPVLLALFVLLGPIVTNPLVTHSGLGIGVDSSFLHGVPTIDPNMAITAFALGLRAAQDVISGQLPLWNHFQGFGAPLLGEMQSAALFPPTLLLLLPSGQALEHIFLQWVGGIGAYLFFRRFGLSTAAAVVGAVLYEFNGVFATLRNAAFNPVAFLPWLMLGVELLRADVSSDRPLKERTAAIAVTAAAGALALYAGFPETAYLYGLMVVAWSVFRMVGLTLRHALTLLGGLTAAVIIALLLSAPLLASFLAFLPDADIGGHGADFVGMVQEKETAILYFFPYLYGLFIAAPDARVAGLSISSGGYIALAPIALAAASLWAPGARAVKIFLCAWIVMALGASHGWPVIHAAFMSLPLMTLAVPGRYLNASWIFCVVFLLALAVDRLPHLDAAQRRRALVGALASTLALFIAAAVPAQDVIPRAWDSVRPAFLASVVGGLLALVAALAAVKTMSARMRSAALAVCVLEAGVLFLIPYFAYPRAGDVDQEAIAFMRSNVGFQRVAKSDGAGLAANFGAAIGVPLLHFDDLPSPRRTIAYLRTRVDPYAGTIFLPESPALAGKELEDRRRSFRESLPDYAAVGVKYVMAAPDFYAEPGLSFVHRDERPIFLAENEVLRIESRSEVTTTLNALTLRTSNFRNTATGSFSARLCAGEVCARGVGDIATADDGKLLLILLDAPLALESGAPYTLEIQKRGAGSAVIWSYPKGDGAAMRVIEAPGKVESDYNIEIGFIPTSRPKPVHASKSMAFYELENVRPYAAAPDCEIALRSHDEMETSCSRPSQLTRLTVSMSGWHARVNGSETPIGVAEDTFQTVDLPQGKSTVTFRYTPAWINEALGAAGAALVFIVLSFAFAVRRRRQNSADAAASLT